MQSCTALNPSIQSSFVLKRGEGLSRFYTGRSCNHPIQKMAYRIDIAGWQNLGLMDKEVRLREDDRTLFLAF